jgi:hypothetical protein
MESRMVDLQFLYNYKSPNEWTEKEWEQAEDFGITKDMMENEIYESLYTARYEYPLCFDYVSPNTFKDQNRGYFRYQISWGGPSEEIRFYVDYDKKPHKIEFWFLDWFTGHGIELSGEYYNIAETIFSDFDDMGTIESEYHKVMEEEL